MSELVEFKNGLNYPGSALGRGLKIIGVSDFWDRTTPAYESLQELSDFDNIDSAYLLQDGDLLFVRSNGSKDLVGRVLLISNPPQRVTFSGFTIRARPTIDTVSPEFLAIVCSSAFFREEMRKHGSGTNISNLNQDILGNAVLALPSLSEQSHIVAVIDLVDSDIRITESLIAAKTEYKRALAEQLLTGRLRFPEFAGHEWHSYHLGQLFTARIEMNRPDLKLLAVTGTDGIVDRETISKRDTSNEDKSKYLRVAPGDIAYNTMRMWQGVFGLSPIEGIVSPAYTVCIPGELIYGRFAAQLFKSHAQIERFRRYSQGLVSDTLNLKFPSFAKIAVKIPAVEEQRKIADVLGLMDEEIGLLRRQRAALKQQKEGLMQKLLTGEIRLKEFAP